MELGGHGALGWSLVICALHFSWSGYAALLSIMFCFCLLLQRSGLVDILFARCDLLLVYKSLASTSPLVWLEANTLYT